MPSKIILIVMAMVIVCMMLFGNKKVRILSVLIKQLQVFKNAKTDKISVWDIVCFIFFPIVLSVIITFGFGSIIDDTLAGVLTTVFAFVFTVLFGFAAILVGKLDCDNEIEKQVVGETFVSIMTSNILSLIASILSIAIIITGDEKAKLILTICVYIFSFMIIMLLLMISKRTFIIYCENKK
ncbi:hypothetical protein [Simiaoa sp.]|uniref:hypothetical protein n=1 Tax=Simiaoa sp. TaxID=2944202 RepID=UPI003F80C5D9